MQATLRAGIKRCVRKAQQHRAKRDSRAMATGAKSAPPAVKGGSVNSRDQREQYFNTEGYRRVLHWVYKTGDLQQMLSFLELLGMSVVRNEFFASACAAGCNGWKSGGAWSKTMAGYKKYGELATHLELTYNFGVDHYDKGNDMRHLAIKRSALVADPSSKGFPEHKDDNGNTFLQMPDGYNVMLVDTDEGSADEPFLFVSLHTTDLNKARKFYTEILGAQEFHGVPGASAEGVMFGWAEKRHEADKRLDCFKVELVPLKQENFIDFKDAQGRLAIETEDGGPGHMKQVVENSGMGSVVVGPIELDPHKEEVVIVADPDGHEYCFVDARKYTNCMDVHFQPGGTQIDWSFRQGMIDAANKAMNGDEAGAKRDMARLAAGDYDKQEINKKIDEYINSAGVVLFTESDCNFCAQSKALLDEMGAEYHAVELDALGNEGDAIRVELGERTGRFTVPNIFINKENVGGYDDGPGVSTLYRDGKLQDKLKEASALKM